MKIKQITEAHEASAQERQLADLGRRLMDISAKMPMKGATDDEIAKSNKMSALGDALTRFGTLFGPKNVKDIIKITGLESGAELLALAKKSAPVKQDAPSADDKDDDEFAAPSDDEIARQADRAAR